MHDLNSGWWWTLFKSGVKFRKKIIDWQFSLVRQLQDTNDADLTPVENHMFEVMTASATGTCNVESAQEVGESSPVILHPLSPITETQHIIANNNSVEKVKLITII